MASLKEKIGYALGDAAAGGITWKIMSIAFPLFFTNVFGLTVADTATRTWTCSSAAVSSATPHHSPRPNTPVKNPVSCG